ncbi:MAG TPA: helix-turn-helix domain-containing protein [Leptospiraceae bacterium]|nr:helix-turn-helix domain-containing protein [Leptospiraceae bacterium]
MRDRLACNALLERLRRYHGCSPVEEIKPAEPVVDPIVDLPAPKPIWFTLVEAEPPVQPKIGDIKRSVCKHFKMNPIDLDSARRLKKITYPRQIGFYLARTLTTRSYPEIGRHFGGKDHTTIIYGVRKIDEVVRKDWRVAFDVAAVEKML